eukprot:361758-Chlamydomonas_euryale.AAC.7
MLKERGLEGPCKFGAVNWAENHSVVKGDTVWSQCCSNGQVIPHHPGLPEPASRDMLKLVNLGSEIGWRAMRFSRQMNNFLLMHLLAVPKRPNASVEPPGEHNHPSIPNAI